VLAGDLVGNLMEQIKQFEPGFTLGERAETIENKRMGLLLLPLGNSDSRFGCCNCGGLGSLSQETTYRWDQFL
jgi:thioredoxin reductase (NADPH)